MTLMTWGRVRFQGYVNSAAEQEDLRYFRSYQVSGFLKIYCLCVFFAIQPQVTDE